MMKELGNLKFHRAVVPDDAISMDINTLDFGDASNSMVCVAIYARFLRSNGKYSCQLIFSRTRVVPKDLSQPRSELYAALINVHTGEIVKRSLGDWHKSSIKLTDSQIVLHWIDNAEKPLKQWVRNRVVEIKQFTKKHQWHYVNTSNMIADLGTRKGATLVDVNKESTWINGFDWMQLDHSKFPIKTAQELKLNESEISEVHKESHFYKKATAEIIHFLHPRKYEPITTLKDDVLIYNGRILSDSKITIVGRFTDAMLDLSSTTFCVPVIDRNSPIAFSIISDIHWNNRITKQLFVKL